MVIKTFAGTGTQGSSGDKSAATSAQLDGPNDAAVDISGNVYIADQSNHIVRMVNSAGIITTFAGTVTAGSSSDNIAATSAHFYSINGIAADIVGNVYISDNNDNRIRLVNSDGIISTFAGSSFGLIYGTSGSAGDGGAATSALLNCPYGVAVDISGKLYIADCCNNKIRMVNSAGTITTLAGTGRGGSTGDGGPATSAQLANPTKITVDTSGNVYFVDYNNYKVRLVNSAGIITTFAGSATYFGDGGAASSTYLYNPYGVAVDISGNVYIAEYDNHKIRVVNSAGIITTFAGIGSSVSTGDGGAPTSCSFGTLSAVAVDTSNRVYVTDGDKVRVISTTKACPAGSYVSSTTASPITCASCPLGSYLSTTNLATSCTLCMVDTYMPSTGATGCTACPAGSTTKSIAGATSVTSCLCLANTYMSSTGGISSCTACPAGSTTNSVVGATSVTSCLCLANTYTTSAGCTVCPAGTTNFVLGATSCPTVR